MRRGMLAVVAAMAVVGCADTVAPLQAESSGPLWDAYRKSIPLAAVKSRDAERDLTPIIEDEVEVASLQTHESINTSYDTWVSLPRELRAHCIGKPDPLLAIQMALGLPPQADTVGKVHRVFVFRVRRDNLFRPCASSSDVRASKCMLEVDLKKDDEHRPFVLRQMIDYSYRRDRDPGVKRFPFTAMGWSYNWDPAAKTPMGVSEYVLRLKAPITPETAMPPAAFCASGA